MILMRDFEVALSLYASPAANCNLKGRKDAFLSPKKDCRNPTGGLVVRLDLRGTSVLLMADAEADGRKSPAVPPTSDSIDEGIQFSSVFGTDEIRQRHAS
jgi:hypothetical protein